MKINSVYNNNFTAVLSPITEKYISVDKKFTHDLKTAIADSKLNIFNGKNDCVSIGLYEESDWEGTLYYPVAVLNTKLCDIDVQSPLLPRAIWRPDIGYAKDERDLVAKIFLPSGRNAKQQVLDSVLKVDINQVKATLAKNYIEKTMTRLVESSNSNTYDKILRHEINFPQEIN